MNLLGQKVIHKTFGEGIINHCSKPKSDNTFNFIVSFKDKEREFLFPNSFEKFLTAVDSDMQNKINRLLKEKNTTNKLLALIKEATDLEKQRQLENDKIELLKDYVGIKREFAEWLIKQDYKVKTPSGLPSTVPQYINAIDKVIKWENLNNWQQVADNINKFVKDYDVFGNKAKLGKISHNTVISALKKFKEFII